MPPLFYFYFLLLSRFLFIFLLLLLPLTETRETSWFHWPMDNPEIGRSCFDWLGVRYLKLSSTEPEANLISRGRE